MQINNIYNSELSSRAVSVYLYLKTRANKDGQCWPSLKTIARDMKIGISTVQRAVNELEKTGFIIKEPRYRKSGANSSTLYKL